MRVLIVNTSENAGGAAVAANRLKATLINNGVKAKMLVMNKQTDDPTVIPACGRRGRLFRFLWDRWRVFCRLRFSKKHLWDIDPAFCGTDITRLPEFREADIIHLHWINQGMLSLAGIRKILDSGKPVVWTMHDMWAATALCHLTLSCQNFKSHCRKCQYLPAGGSNHDLAHTIWQRKQRILRGHHISFVACSQWLAGEARQSALLQGQQIVSIPNPIDTHIFRPADKAEARKRLSLPTGKRLILFVAQRVTNTNKGMSYLITAIEKMVAANPDAARNTAVLMLGGQSGELASAFPIPAISMGYITDPHRIADVYNAADVFVLPSLSENLPNTIMEAMACGVPCVGFRVGGIPEEIDHLHNGYVAAYKDADDLANGINWVLDNADYQALCVAAHQKAVSHYSPQVVVNKYISIYEDALKSRIYES